MADFDSAQASVLVTADSDFKRLDSSQASLLVSAESQLKRLDSAQAVMLVISEYIAPSTRKRSIVVVAN